VLTYVESAVLHENVDRAKDVAEHVEASGLARHESDVRALTWGECQSAVEIVSYRKTMSLRRVIVHDMDDYVLP